MHISNAFFLNEALVHTPDVPNCFDVVLCLGVLHKFTPDEYVARLKQLCNMCAETLVLDMMVIYDDEEKTVVSETHGKWPVKVDVTMKWLTARLKENGFKVLYRERSKLYPERALWIAERL